MKHHGKKFKALIYALHFICQARRTRNNTICVGIKLEITEHQAEIKTCSCGCVQKQHVGRNKANKLRDWKKLA